MPGLPRLRDRVPLRRRIRFAARARACRGCASAASAAAHAGDALRVRLSPGDAARAAARARVPADRPTRARRQDPAASRLFRTRALRVGDARVVGPVAAPRAEARLFGRRTDREPRIGDRPRSAARRSRALAGRGRWRGSFGGRDTGRGCTSAPRKERRPRRADRKQSRPSEARGDRPQGRAARRVRSAVAPRPPTRRPCASCG
jgi:hypothetical protein